MNRRATLVITGLLALALLSFVLARKQYPSASWPVDFGAFYCAGAAVAEHHDPYRTEPLRTCENALRGFPAGSGFQFAVPSPLPGYALAFFALLARMPYRGAVFAWEALLIACAVASVLLLRTLCARRVETIFAALLLTAMLTIFVGQIVPIVVAATVAAAFLVAHGRDRAAALAAALTLLEPHLGLPVCLALFIARPRSRAVLAACCAALAALSVAVLGLAENVEYLRDVLPAQTLSEISHSGQYSLSYVAHLAGLGEQQAATLGTVSYIAMLALGIAGGRIAAERTGKPALLILVPPAFAVLGGPYMHVQQLAIAIPAALVLSGMRFRDAPWCAVAVFLLAVPWDAIRFLSLNLPVVAGVTFLLAIDLLEFSLLFAGLASAAAAALLVTLFNAIGDFPRAAIRPVDVRDGAALAEATWRTFVDVAYKPGVIPNMVAKLLGWGGLLLIAATALGGDPVTRSAASRPEVFRKRSP